MTPLQVAVGAAVGAPVIWARQTRLDTSATAIVTHIGEVVETTFRNFRMIDRRRSDGLNTRARVTTFNNSRFGLSTTITPDPKHRRREAMYKCPTL